MHNNLGFVTINGKECYTISVFDHGLLYGDGVYETVKVLNNKALFFDDHLNRLFSSAKAVFLKIPYSKKELIKLVKHTCKKVKLQDAFIRILVTRGVGEQGLISKSKPNVIIIVNNRAFTPLGKINCTISKVRRTNTGAIDSKIKSLNYLNNILAKNDAKQRGFDEAILLNDNGFLTEATTSNLFIVKNKKIFTPSLDSGILLGITRKVVCENFDVIEKQLTKKDLFCADEAFLSGTANLITSIKKIDKKVFKNFNVAKKVFDKLMKLSKTGTALK